MGHNLTGVVLSYIVLLRWAMLVWQQQRQHQRQLMQVGACGTCVLEQKQGLAGLLARWVSTFSVPMDF